MRLVTGKRLNKEWGVNAKHALYRETGDWYHLLEQFPGALFDKEGYVLFRSRDEYLNCRYLRIANEINVPNGIKKIPGYVRVR